jgi:hypothetical protein
MRLAHFSSMSLYQVELLECALCELEKVLPAGWGSIQAHLRPAFANYMSKDVWIGAPDLFDLRHAALMIVRDAIARTGEFADIDFQPLADNLHE